MNRKKTIICMVLCIAVLLLAVGYAAFATKLRISSKGNITSNWNIFFSSITSSATGEAYNIETPSVTGTTANFRTGLKLPGDKMVYTIVIKNGGTVNAIINDIKITSNSSPKVTYDVSGLTKGYKLAKATEKTFTVTVQLDPNITSLPEDSIGSINLSIEVVQDTGQTIPSETPSIEVKRLNSLILKKNTAQSDTSIDFSKVSSDTNGKGLYYTNKNTEEGKTTYYFRGVVNNNYVSFAGFIWRVVRINEDESIRLIKQDSIGNSAFNTNHTDASYVGYMYGTAGSTTYAATHANTNSSTIKTAVDTWYSSNLSQYSSYLADTGFCGDRSLADGTGIGTALTHYGAWKRLSTNSNKPQYACPQSNDLYTTETATKGNKALTYPIGLITADEVVYAGAVLGKISEDYYLTDNSELTSNYYFLTMTPNTSSQSSGSTIWRMYRTANGAPVYFNPFETNLSGATRPVINLKATVTVKGGTGTSSDPYIILTD